MSVSLQTKTNENIENEFAKACEQICQYFQKYNVSIRPYESESVESFKRLDPEAKKVTLARVKELLSIYEDVEANGEQLKDSPKLVWRALSKMKLTPCSDVFEKIEDDTVVTIYNLDQNQIFRSLRYFDTLSATFEQVCTHPWYELHQYPDVIMNELGKIPEALFGGHIQTTQDLDIPAFPVLDILGPDKIHSQIKMLWMSPVRYENQIVGLITASKVEIVA